MSNTSSSELILVRHGATDHPGHLCGRTDVGLAVQPSLPAGSPLGAVQSIWVSPARRAVETAKGLWPGQVPALDERFWEQDFGEWDGRAYSEIPDVGELSRDELANLAAPGGESFEQLVARVRPAFEDLARAALPTGTVALVAHAGVIRAGLSLAIGHVSGALAFEVDHLSVTRIRWTERHGFSVQSVNRPLEAA